MALPSVARCAVHPARPAADTCPTCGRPRCGVDAADRVDCLGCAPGRAAGATPTAGPQLLEAVVRGGLAAFAVGLCGALVTSEYVGARVFSVVTPLLVGVACGAAAVAAGRPPTGRARALVRAIAALLALVATAYGFRLVPGGQSLLHPAGQVLPPYAAAVAGAWLWTTPTRRGAQRSSRTK